jgi:hypothetical protein
MDMGKLLPDVEMKNFGSLGFAAVRCATPHPLALPVICLANQASVRWVQVRRSDSVHGY